MSEQTTLNIGVAGRDFMGRMDAFRQVRRFLAEGRLP